MKLKIFWMIKIKIKINKNNSKWLVIKKKIKNYRIIINNNKKNLKKINKIKKLKGRMLIWMI